MQAVLGMFWSPPTTMELVILIGGGMLSLLIFIAPLVALVMFLQRLTSGPRDRRGVQGRSAGGGSSATPVDPQAPWTEGQRPLKRSPY